MKIAITIELDKESTELFQISFKKLLKQINDLIGMLEKVDYAVEEASVLEPKMDIEPKPVPTKSIPKKPKKQAAPQESIKATILKAIKNHEEGINNKDLQQKTGLTSKQISDNISHLKKEKKVEKTKEDLFIAL